MSIVGGGGVGVTLIATDSDLATGVDALSVTVTVNAKLPTLVGVPLSDPSFPSVRPGGRLGAVTLQRNGRYPPVALKLNGP